MISVGIVGASGYTGEELIKLLLKHPDTNIDVLTSRTHAGKCVDDVYAFEKKLAIYWLLIIFASLILYSYIAFNDGTTHRYKIVIFSYI